MEKKGDSSSLTVVFDIGVLVIIVGIIVYMIPLFDKVALPIINLLDLWTAFNLLPLWLQITAAGVALSLSAIAVGTIMDLTTTMVNGIFRGRDDF